MKTILFVLLLFIFAGLFAEQLDVDIFPNNLIFNYFYPAYLDANHPELQPQLFTLNATNNGTEAINGYEVQLSFYWRGDLLLDGVVVTPKEEGDFYAIPPGGLITINSRDLIISNDTNGFNSESEFDFESVMDNNPDFKDMVLELGYLPDGEYSMNIQVYVNGTLVSNPSQFVFTIIAPAPITLISPGNPQGLGEAVISDLNPYFVWFSNQQKFTFKLYKIEDEFQNVEDIELQNDPIFEMEEIEATIFAYPSNAEPLEYGSLYAWQVETKIVTPLSESNTPLKSTMYFFKIDNAQVVDSNYALTMSLLMQLDNAQLQELVKLLQSGYKINTMNLGGEEFSLDDLNKLLLDFNEGNFQIKEVDIK